MNASCTFWRGSFDLSSSPKTRSTGKVVILYLAMSACASSLCAGSSLALVILSWVLSVMVLKNSSLHPSQRGALILMVCNTGRRASSVASFFWLSSCLFMVTKEKLLKIKSKRRMIIEMWKRRVVFFVKKFP